VTDLMHVLRAVIREELKTLRLGDIGVVTTSLPHQGGDEHNYECHVKLREQDLELRNVPIATPHVGMVSAPREGDLVLVSYVGGDPNRPIVVGRLYSDKANPPVHAADEWRVETPLAGKTSLAIDKDQSVVITAGKTTITIKQDAAIEIVGEADLKIEVKGDVQLKCTNAKVDASGDIDLGDGGGGVITDKTHKCYFTGAPLVGSITVKAKG
jgi:phage baseplate assembly protein gpV